MSQAEDQTLAQTLSRGLDAAGRLLQENVRLARSELARDAGAWARAARPKAAAVAMLAAGWVLCCAAAAVWLGRSWGLDGALGALGAAHLAVGAALLGRPGPRRRQLPRVAGRPAEPRSAGGREAA